jgi:hypothetical protein
VNIDKNVDQAQAIRAVDDYDALPLTGPLRWAHIHGGMTLYTNDDNVLFARGDLSTIDASNLFQAMNKLREAGKTASEAFDILRLESTTGEGGEPMLMAATHTINGCLAVEVAPRAFVVSEGELVTRTSATKWGGGDGMEILEYSGDGTVEVTAELYAEAEFQSAREFASIAELSEE